VHQQDVPLLVDPCLFDVGQADHKLRWACEALCRALSGGPSFDKSALGCVSSDPTGTAAQGGTLTLQLLQLVQSLWPPIFSPFCDPSGRRFVASQIEKLGAEKFLQNCRELGLRTQQKLMDTMGKDGYSEFKANHGNTEVLERCDLSAENMRCFFFLLHRSPISSETELKSGQTPSRCGRVRSRGGHARHGQSESSGWGRVADPSTNQLFV